MWSSLLTFLGLLGTGIQAGALLMVLYGVCPTFRQLSVPEWMPLHVSLDRSIERYMPAINLTTGGATLLLLFTAQDPAVRLLRGLALACNIALALMSELVNVRINKAIARRVAAAAPAAPSATGGILTGSRPDEADERQLIAVRERWIHWHQWRTVDIVLGFALLVVGVLVASG
ncbi:DUF1772 domain-containing protein [Streptomyces gilvus]|uniref:DUF1772 domain-containing protein n=1 Tax=Streptomyces gilvus TaxID=2920937 RepID=UPI001F0F6B8D|nr:DUF1772 domain-containing protein [Streptomyces sp. CME 23]MCH5670865.1 DUF1772 domain-containing protein [Streptomyces sp. CME 23]